MTIRGGYQPHILRVDLSEDGHCKSLFLRNKKGQMWLVVMLEDQRLDIKALGQALDQRLSFAKPDRLMEFWSYRQS